MLGLATALDTARDRQRTTYVSTLRPETIVASVCLITAAIIDACSYAHVPQRHEHRRAF